MGHRHRAALLDLFFEERNHRTVRSQHVTESCSHELRNLLLTVQCLTVYLTDTFRATHHIRGIHRLVRTDHHEFLRSVFHRQVSNHTRAIDIVLYRLLRIVLHHRHMFIGSGMEHIFRLVFGKDILHASLFTDTRHDGFRFQGWEILLHHQSDVVHRCLCLVYQD